MHECMSSSCTQTHTNQAYADSDSSEDLGNSEQKKSVSDIPEIDPVDVSGKMNTLATGPSESDVSALIELDRKDDRVWDALQGKKLRKKESEF